MGKKRTVYPMLVSGTWWIRYYVALIYSSVSNNIPNIGKERNVVYYCVVYNHDIVEFNCSNETLKSIIGCPCDFYVIACITDVYVS